MLRRLFFFSPFINPRGSRRRYLDRNRTWYPLPPSMLLPNSLLGELQMKINSRSLSVPSDRHSLCHNLKIKTRACCQEGRGAHRFLSVGRNSRGAKADYTQIDWGRWIMIRALIQRERHRLRVKWWRRARWVSKMSERNIVVGPLTSHRSKLWLTICLCLIGDTLEKKYYGLK